MMDESRRKATAVWIGRRVVVLTSTTGTAHVGRAGRPLHAACGSGLKAPGFAVERVTGELVERTCRRCLAVLADSPSLVESSAAALRRVQYWR